MKMLTLCAGGFSAQKNHAQDLDVQCYHVDLRAGLDLVAGRHAMACRLEVANPP